MLISTCYVSKMGGERSNTIEGGRDFKGRRRKNRGLC